MRSLRSRCLESACVLSALVSLGFTVGCGVVGGASSTDPADPPPAENWTTLLSPQQVQTVRQSFPDFQPEEFSPGTSPADSAAFVPSDFAPAEFFGPVTGGGNVSTPQGILVQPNGFDSSQLPDALPNEVTYYDRSGTAHQLTLTVIGRSPLNILQQRMGLPETPDAPVVTIDLRRGRIDQADLADIDSTMGFIREEMAQLLPAVASVNPAAAEISIQPSIFYATRTNFGNAWAGGETEPMGAGQYLIRLADFYISFDSRGNPIIVDWKDYLVDEAENFYVMAIGRSDLAR